MMWRCLLFIFAIVFNNLAASAQNLIVNSSFQRVNICEEVNSPCSPKGWSTSLDIDWAYQHFKQAPHPIERYILMQTGPEYFNYWQSELLVPLQAGSIYELEYFIGGIDGPSTPNDIQFAFLPEKRWLEGRQPITDLPFVQLEKVKTRNTKNGWTKVNATFKARGDERWIITGNFDPGTDGKGYSRAVDNITLQPSKRMHLSDTLLARRDKEITSVRARHAARKSAVTIDTTIPQTIDTLSISGFLFEVDSFRLTRQEIFPMLDSLAGEILSRPFIKVIVKGYTDNSGTASYNQELSEKRAATVAGYLVTKGIPSSQITSGGYGSSQPVSDDKSRNRRVDIHILRR